MKYIRNLLKFVCTVVIYRINECTDIYPVLFLLE